MTDTLWTCAACASYLVCHEGYRQIDPLSSRAKIIRDGLLLHDFVPKTSEKPRKRVVLFDMSGSVVMESRIFDRAYAALTSIFAEHFKDEITVLAFSHITIEIEDLTDLRLGNLRGFGGGSELAQALRFAAVYKPDAVSIITDDAPGFQELREFPFFHQPTALDVRFLAVTSELVQPDLLALVVRNGGTVCRA